MKLCHTLDDVLNFAEQTDLVLKPLQEYGGKGLLRIQNKVVDDGDNSYDLTAYAPQLSERLAEGALLAMKFLKNVNQGDKRIIVVNGEIMAASLRLPPPDSWLCNVARGGTSVPAEVTPAEIEIIQTINPHLLEAGVLIYGADTLVDDNGKRVLSEINTLSIGGFPQAEAQTGRPIVSLTIDKLFKYADVKLDR
jgi:glutathione synthase